MNSELILSRLQAAINEWTATIEGETDRAISKFFRAKKRLRVHIVGDDCPDDRHLRIRRPLFAKRHLKRRMNYDIFMVNYNWDQRFNHKLSDNYRWLNDHDPYFVQEVWEAIA